MMKALFAVGLALAITGCTKPDETRRLLESQGMTDVKVGGYDLFACSKDDTYATKFSATSVSGQQVSGAVCAGMFFKGATIRFD